MRSTYSVLLGVASWVLAYAWNVWAPAQEVPSPTSKPQTAEATKHGARISANITAADLAATIDAFIAQKWQEEQVKPAPLADDAEFLRRVYLDLAGRIPSVAEARAFLDNTNPDKRRELVRQLLQSRVFLDHWSAVLAEAWLASAENALVVGPLAGSLQSWLREQLRRQAGYDRIVFELLSTPTNGQSTGVRFTSSGRPNGSPVAFYQANGYNPRNLTASVSRQFLGIQLDCAECHNHPFARWKREQFWQLAAFFAGFQQRRAGGQVFYTPAENPKVREIQIPDTNTTVQARFLDGSEPNWDSAQFSREVFARWLTSPNNPYFARAAVNRVWYQLLGYGLTDPPDDMHEDNPPSHPELLNKLADAFVQARFDLRFLIEAICLSKTYQLSSRRTDASQDNARLFARRVVRRMTPAQLWDSLLEAVYWNPQGVRAQDNIGASGFVVSRPTNPLIQRRQAFMEKFRDAATRPVEGEVSVLQILALMNGETITSAVQLESSPLLQIVITYPLWNDSQRLEALFLATLSRRPQVHEQSRYLRHIEQSQNREAAWADVLWVLLNSPEFLTNH